MITETPERGRRVKYNHLTILEYRKKCAGFFVILSGNIRSAGQAFECYGNYDVVENSFDDLKNQLDMKPLQGVATI